jgi:hypothetical protein
MTTLIPPEETHGWLKDHFERQQDIGLGKAIVNIALSPRNPFEPEARRLPRPGFVFSACLFTFAISWFLYFNFVR